MAICAVVRRYGNAQAEIDKYRRLQQMNGELIEVNEKISKLRPLASDEGWTAHEKNGCCGP